MQVLDFDVHKNTICYAIYNGKAYSEIKQYDTTTPKIRQLGESKNF